MNNYWWWKLDKFLWAKKKIGEHGLEKKKEVPRKFKNEWFVRQLKLTAFCDCCGLVYIKFGLDGSKEKRNITLDTYFDTSIHLKNAMQSRRWGLLSQKVVVIHDNACPHRAQLIQTLMKDFHWEQFEHPPY